MSFSSTCIYELLVISHADFQTMFWNLFFLCLAGLDPRKPLVKNILECKHMMEWDHILILLGMFMNTCKMPFAIWAMKYLTQGVSCEVWSWYASILKMFIPVA